jgi:peptidoglycan hydrolase CwlO-like protein
VAATNARLADDERKLQQSEEALTEANAKLRDCEHHVLELSNSVTATKANLAPLQCEVEQRNATMGAANAWVVDWEAQLLEQRDALNSTDFGRAKLIP